MCSQKKHMKKMSTQGHSCKICVGTMMFLKTTKNIDDNLVRTSTRETLIWTMSYTWQPFDIILQLQPTLPSLDHHSIGQISKLYTTCERHKIINNCNRANVIILCNFKIIWRSIQVCGLTYSLTYQGWHVDSLTWRLCTSFHGLSFFHLEVIPCLCSLLYLQ
jgi:hypothetical protein